MARRVLKQIVMFRHSIITLLLFTPTVATAEGTTSTAPATPETPAEQTAPLRDGLHVGITVGGAAIPATDLSVVVAQLNLNLGRDNVDLRISPMVYRATGEKTSTGIGAAFEIRRNLGSYAIAGGSIVSLHSISGQSATLGTGVTASPAIFRFGSNKSMDLALTLFVMTEMKFESITPGGYVSFSRLFL